MNIFFREACRWKLAAITFCLCLVYALCFASGDNTDAIYRVEVTETGHKHFENNLPVPFDRAIIRYAVLPQTQYGNVYSSPQGNMPNARVPLQKMRERKDTSKQKAQSRLGKNQSGAEATSKNVPSLGSQNWKANPPRQVSRLQPINETRWPSSELREQIRSDMVMQKMPSLTTFARVLVLAESPPFGGREARESTTKPVATLRKIQSGVSPRLDSRGGQFISGKEGDAKCAVVVQRDTSVQYTITSNGSVSVQPVDVACPQRSLVPVASINPNRTVIDLGVEYDPPTPYSNSLFLNHDLPLWLSPIARARSLIIP